MISFVGVGQNASRRMQSAKHIVAIQQIDLPWWVCQLSFPLPRRSVLDSGSSFPESCTVPTIYSMTPTVERPFRNPNRSLDNPSTSFTFNDSLSRINFSSSFHTASKTKNDLYQVVGKEKVTALEIADKQTSKVSMGFLGTVNAKVRESNGLLDFYIKTNWPALLTWRFFLI